MLGPPHRHLFVQSQTSILQGQPQGGVAHVSPQRRGVSRQVRVDYYIVLFDNCSFFDQSLFQLKIFPLNLISPTFSLSFIGYIDLESFIA